MPKLRKLDLSYNHIDTIQNRSFMFRASKKPPRLMDSLKYLDLRKNPITRAEPDAFRLLPKNMTLVSDRQVDSIYFYLYCTEWCLKMNFLQPTLIYLIHKHTTVCKYQTVSINLYLTFIIICHYLSLPVITCHYLSLPVITCLFRYYLLLHVLLLIL